MKRTDYIIALAALRNPRISRRDRMIKIRDLRDAIRKDEQRFQTSHIPYKEIAREGVDAALLFLWYLHAPSRARNRVEQSTIVNDDTPLRDRCSRRRSA